MPLEDAWPRITGRSAALSAVYAPDVDTCHVDRRGRCVLRKVLTHLCSPVRGVVGCLHVVRHGGQQTLSVSALDNWQQLALKGLKDLLQMNKAHSSLTDGCL